MMPRRSNCAEGSPIVAGEHALDCVDRSPGGSQSCVPRTAADDGIVLDAPGRNIAPRLQLLDILALVNSLQLFRPSRLPRGTCCPRFPAALPQQRIEQRDALRTLWMPAS